MEFAVVGALSEIVIATPSCKGGSLVWVELGTTFGKKVCATLPCQTPGGSVKPFEPADIWSRFW